MKPSPCRERRPVLKENSHIEWCPRLTLQPKRYSVLCGEMPPSTALLRVLYIDDDEIALTITQLQLLKAGIHTEATTDALEAVSMLTSQEIDLILIDSVMPTIDGVEFLQLIRSLRLEQPAVFLTGHSVDELREVAVEFTVLDILHKQTDRLNLPERLMELHAGYLQTSAINRPYFSGGHPAAS